MGDNKELVTEVTENVDEQATEELVDGSSTNATEVVTEEKKGKYYTDEEFDKIIQTRLGRQERTIRKEYDKKYGRLENVLKAGLEDDNLESITDQLSDFYTKQGKQIPSTPQYSQREIEILANAEANDIIDLGYDDVVEEVDRLADIGVDNMTPQEKLIFSKLAKERTRIENEKELASIGITQLDNDFQEFANKLNPNLSIKEKYEMYTQMNPKKKGEPIGSMKSGQMNKTKDYYTDEEISRMTLDDLDSPEVWEAVRKSMTGQS